MKRIIPKLLLKNSSFDTNQMVLVNTNKFDKVIENLKAFCDAGGFARVDSLVFEHNEHEVDELESYLLSLGVKGVNFVSTTRFYEMKEFEVHDNNGNVEYTIAPAQTERFKKTSNNSLINFDSGSIEHAFSRLTNAES